MVHGLFHPFIEVFEQQGLLCVIDTIEVGYTGRTHHLPDHIVHTTLKTKLLAVNPRKFVAVRAGNSDDYELIGRKVSLEKLLNLGFDL